MKAFVRLQLLQPSSSFQNKHFEISCKLIMQHLKEPFLVRIGSIIVLLFIQFFFKKNFFWFLK